MLTRPPYEPPCAGSASPALHMKLRLGEGSGAALALPLLKAAAAVVGQMGTLDEAIQEQFECKAFVGHRHCQRLVRLCLPNRVSRVCANRLRR